MTPELRVVVRKMLEGLLEHPCSFVFKVYTKYYREGDWGSFLDRPPPYSIDVVLEQLDCGIYEKLSEMTNDMKAIRHLINQRFHKESLESKCAFEVFRLFDKGIGKLAKYTTPGWFRATRTLISKVQFISTMDLPVQLELRTLLSMPLSLNPLPTPAQYALKPLPSRRYASIPFIEETPRITENRTNIINSFLINVPALNTKEHAKDVLSIILRYQPELVTNESNVIINMDSLNINTLKKLTEYTKLHGTHPKSSQSKLMC